MIAWCVESFELQAPKDLKRSRAEAEALRSQEYVIVEPCEQPSELALKH